MKKLTLLSILLLLISITSCYQQGPMGPMGPQGQSGQNGQDGIDGTTPKVYYFDMQLNQFAPQSYNSSWVTYGFIDGYTITDNDLVYAYAYLNSDGDPAGDNYWQSLPFNEYLDNGQEFIEHSFGIMNFDNGNVYLKGDIMFWMRRSTGAAPYNPMNSPAILTYKVIVVRGVQGKKAEIPETVNTKNIYELEKYLNIPHER